MKLTFNRTQAVQSFLFFSLAILISYLFNLDRNWVLLVAFCLGSIRIE